MKTYKIWNDHYACVVRVDGAGMVMDSDLRALVGMEIFAVFKRVLDLGYSFKKLRSE